MKNNKKISSRPKNLKFSSYFCDTLFGILLILIACLESGGAININGYFDISINVIISLLPAIITIITVAIQMQNKKVHGVYLRELERLKTGFHYSVLHASCIIISIFAAEFAFSTFDLKASLIALDLISIFYSFVFIAQQIPFLMNSEWAFTHFLKKYSFNDNNGTTSYNNPGFTLFTNLLMTYGLQETFERLKNRKTQEKDLILKLLNYEIDYLKLVNERVENSDARIEIDFLDIDVVTAINNAFESLDYLLLNDTINITILGDGDNVISYLVNITFLLKKITESLKLQKKFKEKLFTLVGFLFLKIRGSNFEDLKHIYRYILIMSSLTIKDGEMWFLESIRDKTFTPYFFDPLDNPVAYLLVMYLTFCFNSTHTSPETKRIIHEFANQHSNGLNSEGYTIVGKMEKSIRNANSGKRYFDAFSNILKIKNLVNEGYFHISPKHGGVYSVDDSAEFSNELILDYFMQIIVCSYFYDIDQDAVQKFVDGLPILGKELIFSIESRWFNINVESKRFDFFKFIYGKHFDIDVDDLPILSYFKNAINKHYEDESVKDKTKNINDIDLAEIKDIIDKRIPEMFANININDKENDNEKWTKKYFGLRMNSKDDLSLIDSILKNIEFSFHQMIKNEIARSSQKIINDGFLLTENTISTLIDFRADFRSESFRLDHASDLDGIDALKGIKIERKNFFPNDFFYHKNGISVRFRYCFDDSIPRTLRNDEIDHIIDNEYTLINGYYRYNNNYGSSLGNFFVKRERLFEFLKNRTAFVPIVFEYSILVDKKECLLIKDKE